RALARRKSVVLLVQSGVAHRPPGSRSTPTVGEILRVDTCGTPAYGTGLDPNRERGLRPEEYPQRLFTHLVEKGGLMDATDLRATRTVSGRRQAKAKQQGWAMSFAVVDNAGNPVALARMDGAGWLTAGVAQSKAFTAATFRRPSAEMAELVQTRPHL